VRLSAKTLGVTTTLRNILITGASRGFGAALTRSYFARGCRVFGLVRKSEDARKLESSLASCIPIVGDVTSPSVCAAIRAALNGRDSALDILVNNAGIGGNLSKLESGVEDEVLQQLQVHCVGALRVTRCVMPFLQRSSRALVVNITSRFGSIARTVSGDLANRGISYSYVIAKAAQNMLTLRLAEELRNTPVNVCCVHPGVMRTASGHSPDAFETAELAAERFVEWSLAADARVHGEYLELDTGHFGWSSATL
jgi:NAD(P)-dependent dehydrogenase (short-subunit alcohol dehydrogenase family)